MPEAAAGLSAGLAELPRHLLTEDEAKRFASLEDLLAAHRLYVVALGEFKRGKSSLLNALVGQAVFPVGVTPVTSVVTFVQRGPEDVRVEFEDGSERHIDRAELHDYVTERGNPDNRKGVSGVVVTLADTRLPSFVVLVDTPGLGSVFTSGTELTRGFLTQVDVALLVLSVDQPLSGSEERLATELRDRGAEVVIALNKVDMLDEQELAEARSFVRERLVRAGLEDSSIFCVSARRATRGESADSGIPDLLGYLGSLLEERADDLFSRQTRRRTLQFLDELQLAYGLRLRIIERTQSELDQALEALRTERARLDALAREEEVLFADRVQAIDRGINDRCRSFQDLLSEQLSAALSDVEQGLTSRSPELEIDERFYSTIAARLDERLDEERTVIGAELGEAAQRLSGRLAGLAAELAQITGRLLGVTVPPPPPVAVDHVLPHIDVKLRDDPVALEQIAGGLATTLPAPLRRKLVLRRSRERALELANRHAGRLRSGLSEQLHEAARRASADGHEGLRNLRKTLDDAIARASEVRRCDAASVAGEVERVKRVLAAVQRARRAFS